nr:uncharacterized protein LOC107385096 [Nothobranchius furzeri]
MHWRNHLLCFFMTLLMSFKLCKARADEEEERKVEGAHVLSHVESGSTFASAVLPRPGSLKFKQEHQVSQRDLAAKLKLMNPSVQCGNDRMTLTVKRARASHFLVDTGEEPLTPLAQMPSTCGFSVRRSRRDVQYAASYQSCHVSKEDSDYVLPLLFRGAPMTMSCPNMLTSPAVVCFPSKMVVKLGGVAAKDLKLKVSGTWQPLSSACSSCGVTFKEVSGEVALIVPYSRDLCVEMKDGEYFLSLQWADFELLTTCPPVPSTDSTTETAPPSGNNKFQHHPQHPYMQQFAQIEQPWPTQSPLAPVPSLPPLFVVTVNSPENQKIPEAQSPALSFMPQLSQFFVLPRAESPPQLSVNDAVKQVQFHQMSKSPSYQVPVYPEFPMVPGTFQPITSSPLPSATSTETPVAAPAAVNKENHQLYVPLQFPGLPQHLFPTFLKHPLPSNDDTQAVEPKSGTEELKPQHLHPHIFQFPMLYSSLNYPSQGQNAFIPTPVPAPATIPANSGPTKTIVSFENSFYQPHPYIPVYFVPEQASMPVFLPPPPNPQAQPVPLDQHNHKPVYHPMQSFYPFLPDQRHMALTGS